MLSTKRSSCSLTIAVMATASAAALGQGHVVKRSLEHRRIERTYNLYVPSTHSADGVMPLVINMHGLDGNADQQMVSSAMNAVAEENGFLVAYPNAIDGRWNYSADLGFIDALLMDIDSEYGVDSWRTYSTGYSRGGIMAYTLASARPDTFAAIASVAGHRFGTATPTRPFPVMHVHGTADVLVPVDGATSVLGSTFPLLDSYLNERAQANGCDLPPTATELPNLSVDDDSSVSVLAFGGCDTYTSRNGTDATANVLYYRVNGGGHTWPVLESDRNANLNALEHAYGADAIPLLKPLNSDFSASHEIWRFFEQHTLPVPEPHGLHLVMLGLLGLMVDRNRRRQTAVGR